MSIITITINALEVGMYVHDIIEQKGGSLKIKSKGRITSKAAIAQLKKKGVVKLAIDTSKQVESPTEEVSESSDSGVALEVPIDKELTQAIDLHKRGKQIQETLYDAVQQGLPFKESIPKEFTHSMVGSINRNPNALLLLSKMREKDDYLIEHSLNVAILLAHFGRHIGMSDHEIEELAYSGFIHDLGKIKVPDDILHKPGKLTDSEMQIMQMHVTYGVDFLNEMGIEQHIIKTVSEHHERLDGFGYPAKLTADNISRAGRMLAIADMYDALTADRCYKAGMPSQKALQILMQESKTRLDAVLLQQFIKCMGIYPIGSLVKLSNERIAMVVAQNPQSPLKPKVKIFYSASGNHYLVPKDIDLSTEERISVDKAVLASDYNIDINRFFHESIVP